MEDWREILIRIRSPGYTSTSLVEIAHNDPKERRKEGQPHRSVNPMYVARASILSRSLTSTATEGVVAGAARFARAVAFLRSVRLEIGA